MKTFAKRFGIGQWSFIGPGSEKKWYLSENSPQGEWDHIAEDMLLRFAESGHPIFRATVEGINPAPHIHEQMAMPNYVQMATTLRAPLRITTSRLSTMR